MLKVCTARSKVFAWKLKLSWWPWWPPKLFVYFTHSNIAKREIMWRLFALLIYGAHSCKLKLKRLTWCKKTFLSNNKFELFGADADWILSVSELDLNILFWHSSCSSALHCNLMTNYGQAIEILIPTWLHSTKWVSDQECSQCKIIGTFLLAQTQIQLIFLVTDTDLIPPF